MSQVDRVSHVAAQLEKDILSGKLATGDLLPSERELSTSLGVSRSVVREALGRLASLGLVKATHGSGTRVAEPGSKQVVVGYQRLLTRPDHRLEDLSHVRLPLETAIAAAAALHRTDAHLARLRQTQAILGDNTRSLEEHAQADLDFHSTLAEATGNPLFKVVLAPIQELLIQSRHRTLGTYGVGIAHDHHAAILDAVARQDADAAVRAMRFHIEANMQHLGAIGQQR
jgi:GntR family transcriptional repressor for pyruvate dehydrogenase complex